MMIWLDLSVLLVAKASKHQSPAFAKLAVCGQSNEWEIREDGILREVVKD